MTSPLLAGSMLAAFLAGGPSAIVPLKSGPQVGCDNDRRGFRPNFVAGAAKGEKLCPV